MHATRSGHSNPPRFDHSDNILRKVEIMKLSLCSVLLPAALLSSNIPLKQP
jgi:hypothetical protein